MDDVTLADLEHENMLRTLSLAAGQMEGAIVRVESGVSTLLTGMPLRLFNQVLITDAADPAAEDAVRRSVEQARERDDAFVVTLRPGTDDRFRPVMTELGLTAMEPGTWLPGMALYPIPQAAPSTDSTLEIRRVTDGAGVRDHIVAAAAGFEMPIEWLEMIMSERLLDEPDASLYVGYLAGEPVVAGFGVRTGRTIGVYNIATVPSARRHGYGAAMTMRLVDDGVAAGADVAILQASDMGKPIYERLGFRTVIEYDAYIEPDPA